jgi:hypothetical protein
MSDDERRSYGEAYLRVRARERGPRGDAAIGELPFEPSLVRERGFVFESGNVVTKKTVTRATKEVDLAQLEDAVAELVAELRPHTAALRALRERVRMRLTVVAYTDGEWSLRLTPETIAWLTEIDAALWIDTFLAVPDGTEDGTVCGFCNFERPDTNCEKLVDALGAPGPYRGIADARLVVCSLDPAAQECVFRKWPSLAAPLDDLNVLVLAGKPWLTTPRRDGAAAVPILLRRLHKHRAVWRALGTGNPTAIEVRARHWSNIRNAGAWLRRSDLRQMARLNAMFHYSIVPDLKPSFREDGSCNHCAYVQPWFIEEPQTGESQDPRQPRTPAEVGEE